MERVTTKESISRLKHLVSVLKKVPEKKFNMYTWGYKEACGTTACALGWAAQDKEFKKKGLVSSWYDEAGGIKALSIYLKDNTWASTLESGQFFFGLTQAQANKLFTPYSNGKNTTANVIGRIKSVIKKKQIALNKEKSNLRDKINALKGQLRELQA